MPKPSHDFKNDYKKCCLVRVKDILSIIYWVVLFFQGNEYPLGVCTGSTYYITVNIPDIVCDRCYLRLTNILLDHADSKCTCICLYLFTVLR